MNLIAAIAANNVIGYGGKLPWPTIPEDMKRFRRLTTGGIVIMGSRTFLEDLEGKPLPNRKNIVITRDCNKFNVNVLPPFTYLVYDLKFAGKLAKELEPDCNKHWVIGGQEIFNSVLRLGMITKMYITHINKDYGGDRHFDCDWTQWSPVSQESYADFSFVTYER